MVEVGVNENSTEACFGGFSLRCGHLELSDELVQHRQGLCAPQEQGSELHSYYRT